MKARIGIFFVVVAALFAMATLCGGQYMGNREAAERRAQNAWIQNMKHEAAMSEHRRRTTDATQAEKERAWKASPQYQRLQIELRVRDLCKKNGWEYDGDDADERVAVALKEYDAQQATNRVVTAQTDQSKAEIAKAKALRFNQDQAAKGDAFGLFRMGERYRDGDGVPKDLANAREYLTKAAAAGAPDATAALSKLNQASTNSPATQ